MGLLVLASVVFPQFTIAQDTEMPTEAENELAAPQYIAANWDEGYYAWRKSLIDHVGPLFTDLHVLPTGTDSATVMYHGWTDVADEVRITWRDPSGAVITRDRSLQVGNFTEEFSLTGFSKDSDNAVIHLESIAGASPSWAFLNDTIVLNFDLPNRVVQTYPWEASRWSYYVGDTGIEGVRAKPLCCSPVLDGNVTLGGTFTGSGTPAPCADCTEVIGTVRLQAPSPASFVKYPCSFCRVEIWESAGANKPNSHRQLDEYSTGKKTVQTNEYGHFSMWVWNRDYSALPAHYGIDPYIAVDLWDFQGQRISMRAPNEIGDSRAEKDDAEYYYRHGKAQATQCPSGSQCDLGTIVVHADMDVADGFTSSNVARKGQISEDWDGAAWVRHEMIEASSRLDAAYNYDPYQVQVGFPADKGINYCGERTNSDTAFFFRSCNGVTAILLGSRSGRNSDTMAHEYGHFVMWYGYGSSAWPNPDPPQVCPQPHRRGEESPAECAWKEGWAEFYALTATGSPERRYTSTTIDFDCYYGDGTPPPSWDRSGDQAFGQLVEGRVTAALWDFIDSRTCDGSSTDDDGVDWTTVDTWLSLSWDQPTTFDEYHTAVEDQAGMTQANDLRSTAWHNGVLV